MDRAGRPGVLGVKTTDLYDEALDSRAWAESVHAAAASEDTPEAKQSVVARCGTQVVARRPASAAAWGRMTQGTGAGTGDLRDWLPCWRWTGSTSMHRRDSHLAWSVAAVLAVLPAVNAAVVSSRPAVARQPGDSSAPAITSGASACGYQAG